MGDSAGRDDNMGASTPDAERGGTSTEGERAPLESGRVPASLPACLARMLDVAAKVAPDDGLERTLARLLGLMAALEPSGAAAVVLRDEPPLRRGALDLAGEPAGERLLPGLAEQVEVPLPGPVEGRLVIAAPKFHNGHFEAYRLLAMQAAGVVTLVVRMLEGEMGGWTPTTSGVPPDDSVDRAQLHKLAALGQNASEIVHELSNPLTSILAYSDYLAQRLRKQGVGESDLERLRRIHEAATRIQQFSRDLTHYAKPGPRSHERVSLHALADRALRFCVHGLRSSNISVERDYGAIPEIDGVDTALTQVFVNLITNAWHAMSDGGGVLRIRTALEEGWVVVEVADDGHGIPEAMFERVFEQYFTTKGPEEGSGLGLGIVKQTIVEHRGRIEARPNPTGGAVFALYFPVPA